MDEAQAGFLEAHRCRIYVHQPSSASRLTDAEHRNDQYAVHWWLQHALQGHPWRVHSPVAADVIYFNGSLTYGRKAAARWDLRLNNRTGPAHEHSLGSAVNELTAQLHNLGNKIRPSECESVWFATSFNTRFGMHRQVVPTHPCLRWVRELDTGFNERYQPLVAPFVLASPSWLMSDAHDAAAASQPARRPWEKRKLLFFAGHMPNLHISNVRWNLWRALQGDPRVTLYTTDLIHQAIHARACRISARPGETWAAIVRTYLLQECARYCKKYGNIFLEECSSPHAARRELCLHSHYGRPLWSAGKRHPLKNCPILAAHNVSAVTQAAGEELLAPVRLGRDAYMAEVMSHRFCVIAPGDDMSTHKIGELMALRIDRVTS